MQMYPNLKAELARKNLNMVHLAEFLNVRYATVNSKVNGKYQFTLKEALAIREKFFPDLQIEYLFEPDADKGDDHHAATKC